jgi:hypothetical protein
VDTLKREWLTLRFFSTLRGYALVSNMMVIASYVSQSKIMEELVGCKMTVTKKIKKKGERVLLVRVLYVGSFFRSIELLRCVAGDPMIRGPVTSESYLEVG